MPIGPELRAAGYNGGVPSEPLPPPHLVQTAPRLRALIEALKAQPRLAVDTESNSLYAYRERVCLIQLSVPGADYLVDPLALEDLSPLGPLFADPACEKVFHAAEYDLICLRRDFGFRVHNLFDTRVAWRTLGRGPDGLGDILAAEFDVRLNKRLQRADWGQRPLPADLLDYARLDTHYLLPLRDRLAHSLRDSGREIEAAEECRRLASLQPPHNGFDPQGFWRITHARLLSAEQAGVLRQLYQLREDLARRADRPPFKVLGDRVLLAIAQTLPADREALAALPGMTSGQMRRYGEALLAAVARGRKAPHPRPPAGERVDDAALARHEALRAWRKRTAAARKVESDVILPREVLWDIACAAPRTPEALRAVMDPLAWRWEAYADEILRVLWGGRAARRGAG